MPGALITTEGIECCGKTTQHRNIADHLRARGVSVVTSREPGGTPVGEALRGILKYPEKVIPPLLETLAAQTDGFAVNHDHMQPLPLTELLLFPAARYEYIERVLKPMLATGNTVISDRFHDSTRAYQGGGRFKSDPKILQIIEMVYEQILGGFRPNITFFIDISIEEMRRRIALNPEKSALFEQLGDDFFMHARAQYLAIAEQEEERFIRIDGERSPEEVFAQIEPHLARYCIIPN